MSELASSLHGFFYAQYPNRVDALDEMILSSEKILEKCIEDEIRHSAIQWLEDAGIITLCYNLSNLEISLEGNKIEDVFKIYVTDAGLFVFMLEKGTVADILEGNLKVYKVAIFENIIADAFNKMDKDLYYYHKQIGLEIDFVTRYNNELTLIEVKSIVKLIKFVKIIQ